MKENFIRNYEYYQDVSLKKYNTYQVETKCHYLIYPKNEEELIELIRYLKEEKIDYLILGGGSNVILARDSFEVVIKLDRLNKIEINENIVTAGAGVNLIVLANMCMNKGLNGLSFAGGIPGLVGASTAMNAGAYKEDMSGIVREVRVLTPDLDIKVFNSKDLEYGYRDSFLKKHKDYICLETTFELFYEDSLVIKETMDNRKARRVETQPLDMPSAGSVFRNPPDLAAGKLIEDIGLKGYQIGGAKVSEKHANFIVNNGGATYHDIIDLIEEVQDKVEKEYNIKLILEQEIIR